MPSSAPACTLLIDKLCPSDEGGAPSLPTSTRLELHGGCSHQQHRGAVRQRASFSSARPPSPWHPVKSMFLGVVRHGSMLVKLSWIVAPSSASPSASAMRQPYARAGGSAAAATSASASTSPPSARHARSAMFDQTSGRTLAAHPHRGKLRQRASRRLRCSARPALSSFLDLCHPSLEAIA